MIIKALLTHSEVPKMQLRVQQAHFLYQRAKTPTLLALGKNWPCSEPPLPHPPFLLSKQSKKKQCFLVFFIAGAIHLLFHLLNFLLTAHVPIVVLGNHVVQTLGTPNCERSSATPFTPDADAPLVTPRSASYCELGFKVRGHTMSAKWGRKSVILFYASVRGLRTLKRQKYAPYTDGESYHRTVA